MVVDATSTPTAREAALRVDAVLDLVAADDVDEPVFVLLVVQLLADRGQVELEHVRDEEPDLGVVVVAPELLDLRAVRDQVDVDGGVAELDRARRIVERGRDIRNMRYGDAIRTVLHLIMARRVRDWARWISIDLDLSCLATSISVELGLGRQ